MVQSSQILYIIQHANLLFKPHRLSFGPWSECPSFGWQLRQATFSRRV